MGFSQAQAYTRFKISPALKKRHAVIELVESRLSRAKRTDGFYGFRLSGPLRTLKPVPSKLGLGRNRGGGNQGRRRGGRRG